MHSSAAALQYSGGRKRCISSLQVTYHQEIHRPVPRLTHQSQSQNSSDCVDHRLEEDGHSQEAGRLVPDNEEQDFFGPPSLPGSVPPSLPPFPPPDTHWDPSPQKFQPASIFAPPISLPNLPSFQTAPINPLFGLEDCLCRSVNVEIEKFRASLQEVIREQFVSQRLLQAQHDPHCTCHCQIKEENQDQACNNTHTYPCMDALNEADEDENGQSIETSIDSGVCVEAGPTTEAPEATPPPPGGGTSEEEEMSLALIRLQTLAAAITANLQQAPELSSTRGH